MNSFLCTLSPIAAIYISLSWFSAGLIIHFLICRISGSSKYMAKGLITGFLLIILLFSWQVYRHQINLIPLFYTITLWLAYMMFFINLLNSITLKMLNYLNQKGGKLRQSEFSNIFGGAFAIMPRITAIKRNNFLIEKNKKLEITKKGKHLLFAVKCIRKTLGIK